MEPNPVPVELPRFEVPGTTAVFDLMDDLPGPKIKMPFWNALDTMVGPTLRRYGFNSAVKGQINSLAPMIATHVGTGRVGYLLRINIYADEFGWLYFPAGEIVSAYGLGIEPLDALAETYRAGTVRNPRPEGLRDESRYCWMVREGKRLTCTYIPPELAHELEAKGQAEAERRDVLGGFLRVSEGSLEQTQVAEHWSEVVRARLLELDNLGVAEKVGALQKRMEHEQDTFNQAYAGFQRITREMAHEARERRLLGAIGTVLDLVSTGIQVHDRLSTPTHTAKAPLSRENVATLRMNRTRVLKEGYEQLTIEVNTSADTLERLQSTLRGEFQSRGIPVPRDPQIPRIIRE